MDNMIDHPEHYRKPGRKECIDEMLEQFGPVAVYWFSVLSAYKYRYRAGDKPDNAADQDEAKGEWYDCKAEDMRGLGAPDGWIKCSEKLPAKHRVLLFVAYGMSVQYGMYRGDRDGHKTWEANGYTFWDDEVTHWMTLPNLPEDENNGKSI